MAFADDLLKLAAQLVERGGKNPRQATLRRGVSTSYYALFHLLIADFVTQWKIKEQRTRLARMFDHGRMSNASLITKVKGKPDDVEKKLKFLVEEFGDIQGARHAADYDLGYLWTQSDARSYVARTEKAFALWREIRNEKAARDHLLSMFGARNWPVPSASV